MTWLLFGSCLFFAPISLAQDLPPFAPFVPNNSSPSSLTELYFADIIVRGRPIFQMGSLADISASERAQIINRR